MIRVHALKKEEQQHQLKSSDCLSLLITERSHIGNLVFLLILVIILNVNKTDDVRFSKIICQFLLGCLTFTCLTFQTKLTHF